MDHNPFVFTITPHASHTIGESGMPVLPGRGETINPMIKAETTKAFINGHHEKRILPAPMMVFCPATDPIVGKSSLDLNGTEMTIDSVFRYHPVDGSDSNLVMNLIPKNPTKKAM